MAAFGARDLAGAQGGDPAGLLAVEHHQAAGDAVFEGEGVVEQQPPDRRQPHGGDRRWGAGLGVDHGQLDADQADHLPGRFHPAPGNHPEIAHPQAVLDAYLARGGPALVHVAGDRADYHPATDTIRLPARAQFRAPEGYYATAFHEAGHSTGHPGREQLVHKPRSQVPPSHQVRHAAGCQTTCSNDRTLTTPTRFPGAKTSQELGCQAAASD